MQFSSVQNIQNKFYDCISNVLEKYGNFLNCLIMIECKTFFFFAKLYRHFVFIPSEKCFPGFILI